MRIEDKDISLTYEKRKSGLGNENRRRIKTEAKINLIYDKCIVIGKLPENKYSEKSIKIKAWFEYIKTLGRVIINEFIY